MATLTISLPDGLKDFAETQSRSGQFQDVGDYVGDLIRKDQERRNRIAAVQKSLDEGLASGVSNLTGEEILNEARARARKAGWDVL